MFTKKKIIILVGVAAISFGGALMLSMYMAPDPSEQPIKAAKDEKLLGREPVLAGMSLANIEKLRPNEKQLADLISDVKQQRATVKQREKELGLREKRVLMLQTDLAKQVEELEAQRVKLIPILRDIRKAQTLLARTRIVIATEEKANLKHAAKVYEKMSALAAAQTFAGMCKGGQDKDAVIILYLMSVRSAGKVFDAMEDKSLVARLIEQMKRIRGEE